MLVLVCPVPAGGYASLSDAIDGWYNEVKLYNFNNPGWNTATGHFTALVWRSTTKLGCAVNTGCSWPTYVCQYQAPGNVIGLDWSKEVKPAVTTPASPSPALKPSPSPAIKPSPSPAIKPSPASPSPTPKPVAASPKPMASPAPIRQPTAAPVVAPTTADMQKVLELHNTYRKTHQVCWGRFNQGWVSPVALLGVRANNYMEQ